MYKVLTDIGIIAKYADTRFRRRRGLIMVDTKHWYLIDDCTSTKSAVFTDALAASTQAEALANARAQWDRLSPADQRRRDAFYIGFADTDEDGAPDLDTMTDIVEIK